MKFYKLGMAVWVLTILLSAVSTGHSQTAIDYLTILNKMDEEVTKKYLVYVSTVAHGNSARRMEKKRVEVLTAIQDANRELNKLRPFKGDVELRDAYRDYYRTLYSVFNEDYHKIVDMEEIAEQSYDAMEAYMLAQEKATEKLAEASEKLRPAFSKFAESNDIRLTEAEGKDSKKMRQVGLVNQYNSMVYLIFFKSFKQEIYLTTALSSSDISASEQNRSTLVKYVEEGYAKLDTLKPFKGDASLANACRKSIDFHKLVATKSKEQIDLLVKLEEFAKIRKAFEAKRANTRTATDVENFNKSVAEYNSNAKRFNAISEELNKTRNKVYDGWDASRKRFLEAHVPQS